MKSIITQSSQTREKVLKPFFKKDSDGSGFFNKITGTQAFFNPGSVQASLTMGQPNDPYEKEADKVARQVAKEFDYTSNRQKILHRLQMQQILIQPMPVYHRINLKVQEANPNQPPQVQTKCSECEEEGKMSLKSEKNIAGPGINVPTEIESQIKSAQGKGEVMDEETRRAMEASFDVDFRNVRVHTDSKAVQMSQELNAHAFTVGSDIFFNKGRYQPQTKMGAALLAHELTHTVQQGAVIQRKNTSPSSNSDLLANHTEALLFAQSNGLPTTLIGRDMDNAQGQMTGEYTTLQQELLSMKKVGKVQKKDKTLSLRRCSSDGSPCSKTNTATISKAKKAASARVTKALKALKTTPPSAAVLASLKRNFGATDGVPANLPSIISKIEKAHTEMLTVPVNCGTKSDGSCKKSTPPCGYTPGAGAHKYVICINPTLKSGADPIYQLGCVLHEAFHSAFSDFSGDSYSGWNGHSGSSPGYPGSNPLKNADSYTTLVLDLS